MSDLVAISFDDPAKALDLRAKLASLQKQYLITMDDVVGVTRDEDGEVKLHQASNLSAAALACGYAHGHAVDTPSGLPAADDLEGVNACLTAPAIHPRLMRPNAARCRQSRCAGSICFRSATPNSTGDSASTCGRWTSFSCRRVRVARSASRPGTVVRIFRRERRIARDIQLSLLPESKPRVPGFDIAGWNRAADETGGDYFDWHTLDDGRIALVIGDVTGHGLGPAMIVAMCRAYFRASMVPERSLGAVLDHVNELLSTDLTEGRFVTAAVGLIDPTASHMQLFSAGQAPLFFFDAARNRVQAWGADHFPLGIVSAYAAGPPREIEFGAGDTLVLVTDGFLEWPDRNGEHFDEQRLAATILEFRGYSAEELTNALYERVLELSGGTPQRDDLTAVVIKQEECEYWGTHPSAVR